MNEKGFEQDDDTDTATPTKRKPSAQHHHLVDVFADIPSYLRRHVVESPAQMNCRDYALMLRHILRLSKNMLITANFDKLHHALVVSSSLQTRVEARKKKQKKRSKAKSEWRSRQQRDNPEDDAVDSSSKKKKTMKLTSASDETGALSAVAGGAEEEETALLAVTATAPQAYDHTMLEFVDVWLFADDYTYELGDRHTGDVKMEKPDGNFPMLIMQLAHIILLNRIWTKQAKLRVILVVDDEWDVDQQAKFDSAIRELRLDCESVISIKSSSHLRTHRKESVDLTADAGDEKSDHAHQTKAFVNRPDWAQLDIDTLTDAKEVKGIKRDMKKYYRGLNSKIVEMSMRTHLIFMALPPLPSESLMTGSWDEFYFDCLKNLTKDLPPTCLVATGEKIPVMTINV
jgi:hypothetical protein